MRVLHFIYSLVNFIEVNTKVILGILFQQIKEKLLGVRHHMLLYWRHFLDWHLNDLWSRSLQQLLLPIFIFVYSIYQGHNVIIVN